MAANRILNVFFETEPEELYAVLTGSEGKKEIFMEISLAHLWKEEQKEKPG